MAYLDESEVYEAYEAASTEADVWREPYPEYERLADNGLMEGLDENLPEVNDGSLAASLFKLAKRVIKKKLGGRAIALDTEDAYITEFANIQWEKKILKNANAMATPRRKWKDAVRKAAIYGGQPIITLFTDHGADFIVPYAQDVKLEAGKASDMDSDVIFWDVYYTKLQLKNIIEQAKEEMAQAKESNTEAYNKWDIEALEEILNSGQEEDRPGNEEHNEKLDKGVKKNGYHFFIAFQRGVDAPFMMCHPTKKKCVRKWSNPDPTGDPGVRYLYFYQDFVNPYGIGVVKLAGGTQNVLDYFRQVHILATQIGIRPPKLISGDTNDTDFDSFVYAQDADWLAGNAKVERMEMSNQVYQQLPGSIGMYQTSLQKFIPMGDTTISAETSGDPNYSKTPAGIKMQAASLSIDDEDVSENVDECYAAVAKSMINVEFANMQGDDILKVTAEERDILMQAGIEFPMDENGTPSAELEFSWDDVRATFDFEIDPDADKTTDDAQQMEGLMTAVELVKDPAIQQLAMTGQPLILGSKKVDVGELLGTIIGIATDNDKIVTDITPEEMESMQAQPMIDPATGQPLPPEAGQAPLEGEVVDPERDEFEQNMAAVMEQYNVDENTAGAMLEAEKAGFSPEEIQAFLAEQQAPQEEVVNA